MNSVTDEKKQELYDRFGKPPKRNEPLDVKRHNYVVACMIGGPLYSVKRGRVTKTGLSPEEVSEKRSGLSHHDGALAEAGEYVDIRYGPATFEHEYIPPEYVLEIVSPGCKWVGGKGYEPREHRRDFLGNKLD